MKKFIGKIFGGKKKTYDDDTSLLVSDLLEAIIDKGNFKLSFDIKAKDNNIDIEFFGEDEGLLLDREGQLLDAFQLYLKRVVQHQLPEKRISLNLDCDGYREQANQTLIDLAEKLKGIAMDKGKPVYFRALPPRDRKVIHQYLAEDTRVKSRSVGDGLYKKIKIFPVRGEDTKNLAADRSS